MDVQHSKTAGNVLMADGSVPSFTPSQFRTAIMNTSDLGSTYVGPNGTAAQPGSLNRLQFP